MSLVLAALFRFVKDNWRFITILILIILLVGQCRLIDKHKQAAYKWENNYLSEKEGAVKTVRVKELEIKDYLKQNSSLDSALRSERIRKDRIEYVHVIRYRDTGSVRVGIDTVRVLLQDTVVLLIGGSYENKCYKAEWRRIDGEMEYTHNYEIKTDLNIVGHWQRANSFEIFSRKLFSYGRKQTYVTIINNCDSSEILTNEYINFKKK